MEIKSKQVEGVKETWCVGVRVYDGVDVGAFLSSNTAEVPLVKIYLVRPETLCLILSLTCLLGLKKTNNLFVIYYVLAKY